MNETGHQVSKNSRPSYSALLDHENEITQSYQSTYSMFDVNGKMSLKTWRTSVSWDATQAQASQLIFYQRHPTIFSPSRTTGRTRHHKWIQQLTLSHFMAQILAWVILTSPTEQEDEVKKATSQSADLSKYITACATIKRQSWQQLGRHK